MNNARFSKCVAWILVMVMGFALSGCGLLGGGVAKQISETVDAFFEDVTTGRYAEYGFSSDYAEDEPFSSIAIEDERILFFLEDGLTRISYEIEEAKGSKSDGTGECVVIIEVVDIEAVFEEVEEQGYDDDVFLEAISERRAPTIEIEVIFDLEYSSRRDEWKISDSSEFAEKFTAPYLKIELPTDQGAQATFELFVTALENGDIETINQIYSGFWDSLNIYDDTEVRILLAFFEATQFDVLEVEGDDDFATLIVQFEYPDLEFLNEVFSDRQLIESVAREYLLAEYNGGYNPSLEEGFLRYVTAIEDRLDTRTVQMLSSEAIVEMSFDYETEEWIITDFIELNFFADSIINLEADSPFDIYDFDSVAREVVIDLIDEGLVDEEFFAYLLYGMDGSEVTAEILYNDIADTYWVEYENYDERVFSYDARSTHLIEHVVEFYTIWEGVDVIISWYYEVGEDLVPINQVEHTLQGGLRTYSFWLGYQDGETLLQAGTYYVIWDLADGESVFYDIIDIY